MSEAVIHLAAEFWKVLAQMAPYLLLGFFLAGLLSVVIPARLVELHLGGPGFWPVFKAAVFGVPLPLCSCGVIPVASSLRRHGASRAATAAFLLSTPQTGVDSILVTWSLLGGVYAVFRPIAALVSGVLGGVLVSVWGYKEARQSGSSAPADDSRAAVVTGGIQHSARRGRVVEMLHYGFVSLPQDIGRSLLVGLLVAALITVLVPPNFLAQRVGGYWPTMLLMLALGIPIYVCATASVPIAAALILHQGVSPGAALVFLMTGPATNAATIAVIWKTMGRRTTVIYLAAVVLTALGAGLVLDHLFGALGLEAARAIPHDHHAEGITSIWGHVAAIVLLAILANALLVPWIGRLGRRGKAAGQPTAAGGQVRLRVEGMTCGHCVRSVEQALCAVPGVRSAEVDLKGKRAVVAGLELDPAALCRAIAQAGYEARPE